MEGRGRKVCVFVSYGEHVHVEAAEKSGFFDDVKIRMKRKPMSWGGQRGANEAEFKVDSEEESKEA